MKRTKKKKKKKRMGRFLNSFLASLVKIEISSSFGFMKWLTDKKQITS